jgi:hypothetical protein
MKYHEGRLLDHRYHNNNYNHNYHNYHHHHHHHHHHRHHHRNEGTDWIGYYCPSVAEDTEYRDWFYASESASYQQGSGSLEKNLTDLRAGACEFRYFTHSAAGAYDRLGESNAFTINGIRGPYHAHLALTGQIGDMLVHFGSPEAASLKRPSTVMFGLSAGNLNQKAVSMVSHTYAHTDMCGSTAANVANFVDPGTHPLDFATE